MAGSASEPWLAEVEVDERQAARMIHDSLVDLRGLPVRYLGAGWDNTAFRVGDQWLARFPRKASADALLGTECALLPPLSRELPLAVPAPQYIVERTEGYPWRFAVSRWLPGDAASELELSGDQRRAHVAPLAEFLRSLHAVPSDRPYLSRLPREGAGGERQRAVIERAKAALDDAYSQGWIKPASSYAAILERAASHDNHGARERVVCHGDLDARHVIVRGGSVSAVIDWGDLQYAERGIDLALVPTYFEPEDWTAFRDAYGAMSDADWDVALLFALYKSALILRYAVLDGKKGFERTARATLRRLRTAPA